MVETKRRTKLLNKDSALNYLSLSSSAESGLFSVAAWLICISLSSLASWTLLKNACDLLSSSIPSSFIDFDTGLQHLWNFHSTKESVYSLNKFLEKSCSTLHCGHPSKICSQMADVSLTWSSRNYNKQNQNTHACKNFERILISGALQKSCIGNRQVTGEESVVHQNSSVAFFHYLVELSESVLLRWLILRHFAFTQRVHST